MSRGNVFTELYFRYKNRYGLFPYFRIWIATTIKNSYLKTLTRALSTNRTRISKEDRFFCRISSNTPPPPPVLCKVPIHYLSPYGSNVGPLYECRSFVWFLCWSPGWFLCWFSAWFLHMFIPGWFLYWSPGWLLCWSRVWFLFPYMVLK